MSTKLFRESALERLSSPEQLDQVLPTTSTRGWLALLALLAVLGAAGAWAVFGQVPVQKRGHGMLISGAGLKEVVATGTGRLKAVRVAPGDLIEAGQEIAVIDQKDIEDLRDEKAATLQRLREQNLELEAFDASEAEWQEKLAAVELKNLDTLIAFREKWGQDLTAVLQETEKNAAMGRLENMRMRADIQRELLTVKESELQKNQLKAKTEAADFQRRREQLTRRLALADLQGQVKLLEDRLSRQGTVQSTVSGRVLEVRASEGVVVNNGDPIVLVEPADPDNLSLEAILYVSATDGKRLRPDMDVMLEPSTVKREEYGSLVATITRVADGPTSQDAMMKTLADPNLVQDFIRKLGIPMEVRVALKRDPATETRYKWTSERGPPLPLTTGTLCEGWITIERRRPISLVIPLLKDKPPT